MQSCMHDHMVNRCGHSKTLSSLLRVRPVIDLSDVLHP